MNRRAFALLGFRLALAALPVARGLAIDLRYDPVASGFVQPLAVVHAGDGSDRLFVAEQDGRVRIVRPDGSVEPVDFANLSDSGLARITSAAFEQGLLGIAFHPDHAANRLVFFSYTRKGDGASVVERFRTLPANPDQVDPASGVVIFGPVAQPQTNHNGGGIAFGPDGMMYLGLGDGGGANDQGSGHTASLGNAQDPAQLLGKILRIDVDSPDAPLPYGIPADNPFVGIPGFREEIWCIGLRNPWRFHFDRATGRLFCGDVGQSALEEVDELARGANFGWRRMEGSACFMPTSGCQTGALVLPIFEYGRSSGISVTGGPVYRGADYPALDGMLLVADYWTGVVWTLEETGPGTWSATRRTDFPGRLASWGEDEAGEILACDHGGGVLYRLRDADPQPVFSGVRDAGLWGEEPGGLSRR